jgi:hypothetical protein
MCACVYGVYLCGCAIYAYAYGLTYKRMRTGSVAGNQVGSVGAEALMHVLPQCPSLISL